MHGTQLVDEYAWLRNRDDPAVRAHLEAENDYTEAVMADTASLRETLFAEMLARIEEADVSAPVRDGPYRYFSRTHEGREYRVHCRMRPGGGPEETVLDENELARGHAYHRLGALAVSPDHRLVAWSADNEGGETFTIRVRDLATGADLPDRVTGVSWGLEWSADARTLLYTVPDAAMRPYRLLAHELGTPQSDDLLLLEEDDEAFHLGISKPTSRAFVLAGLGSLTTTEIRALDAARPAAAPRTLLARRHGVRYDVTHHGDRLYLRTDDGAPTFRVVSAPLEDPSPANWTDVLPARPDVTVEEVEAFRDHLVVVERAVGLTRVRVLDMADLGGGGHVVAFDEPAYRLCLGPNREFDTTLLRLAFSSLVTPDCDIDYDMATRQRTIVKQDVVHGYDPAAWLCERLWATAPDGVRIPISLVRRRDAPPGPARLLLGGYGAYGISRDATFSPHRLCLLERGFTVATAHVRGGGDLGETWHHAGRTDRKRNTFTDFIACAEHLVAEGWTTPDRMAITGGSAGGLLVGSVLNMRPDLFAAAVAHVPFVDVVNTMLDPSLPLSVIEYEEWGDPRDPEAFAAMRSWSPYDNVSAQHYPAMLVTAGLNDPRVSYWEPAKWVARLRERRTGDTPLLLRTEMGAGHGGPSGRYESLRELAFEYAFLLKVLGEG